MNSLDWVVLAAYFVLMVGMGFWARTKIRSARDFFTAGGEMPWWVAGVSHHMSGYSSAVFTGYAAIAYSSGFNIYIWWACSISIAMFVGARLFAPKWVRLRQYLNMISPLEYLVVRYDLPTQQLLAWSGSILKIFDVGAKWTATAILLQVLANVPPVWGITLAGGVTLVYSVVGGLWADAITDLSQFIIQFIAGIAMLIAVLARLGGLSSLWKIWSQLPSSHSKLFSDNYTATFAVVFLFVNMLSYNGGTWNLAQRFIATSTGTDARKAAVLSAGLYLIWPLVLFFPMWAAPLILPGLQDPSQSYALLTRTLLPNGLIGIVLAGLFAHTMAMTSSDANAISAVVVRDIIPTLRKDRKRPSDKIQLLSGRICTFLFLALSMLIALMSDRFGGVIGLLILWFGALIGPVAIPMVLGLLKLFHRSGPAAAIASWVAGAVAFALIKFVLIGRFIDVRSSRITTITIAGPVLSALFAYVVVGVIWPWSSAPSEELFNAIQRPDQPQDMIAK